MLDKRTPHQEQLMALASETIDLTNGAPGLSLGRYFTQAGQDPYDTVEWELRDAKISHWKTGDVAFEQLGVEVPASWSVNATNILAQKYFRGTMDTDERETSLKQVADRVVDTITLWGREGGYFVSEEEAVAFSDELKYMIIHQKGAFNSPVWFNIGVKDVPQQASACFILAVEDRMDSILNWYVEEGIIFKGGSGAGVNLSIIRSSAELLKGGGTASGPVSFMRGADSSAGTIKSGGKTRRAAKMVMLDMDHPDIEEFIWCKATEERKARILREAGFDMDLDGADSHSIQYQNANNSVRVTDEFMQAVVDDGDWNLIARTTGEIIRSVKARDLMRQFSQSTWECADPGMQYDSTINRWHTSANTGKINGSNPCSEYMHLDNSACNLASLNLLTFLNDDDTFDVAGFKSGVEMFFTAQEILVGRADYPTEAIGETSRQFRQLGLGYANIGALLMNLGLPYDSDEGRAYAASITSLMTGHAYHTSVKIAGRMGPHAGYEANEEHMNRVLAQHQAAVVNIDEELAPTDVLTAAQEAWDKTVELAPVLGVRNAQATVLAPTGTIGLLMDCDTTGIEPDLGLAKMKKLVGGGTMLLVNQSVPRALRRLGYDDEAVKAITEYIDVNKSILGAPGLNPDHIAVFACSMGDNTIHYSGHVKMMAAVQPFISGAISKTVNMPEEVTVKEVEQLHIDAWKMGVKAIAIYRDNCKVGQPLSMAETDGAETDGAEKDGAEKDGADTDVTGTDAADPSDAAAAAQVVEKQIIEKIVYQPVRERLPRDRKSRTFDFRVADCKGFVTVGEYDDGRPGEIFLRVSKQGSTLAGIMDALAISLSHGLQYGVPLRNYVETFTGMRFEPAGMTDDLDIRISSSIMDYLFRKLAVLYMDPAERAGMGIFTTTERTQQTLPGVDEVLSTQGSDVPADPKSVDSAQDVVTKQARASAVAGTGPELIADPELITDRDAPLCMQCGVKMNRSGSCHACPSCGNTSGCS